MRETYIDEIDNIKRIDAFVSYDEYLASPAFKEYVAAHKIKVPARAEDVWQERIREKEARCKKTETQESVASEKETEKAKKVNGLAVLTAVFAIGYIAWCLLGKFVQASINGFNVFALYNGKSFIELITGVIGGADLVEIVATCLLGVSLVFAFVCGVIASLTAVGKKKTSTLGTVGMLVAFFTGVGTGVASIIKNGSSELGVAIAVVIALAAFAFGAIGRRNKAKENG